MWNEKYAGPEFLYGKEPNAFIKEQIASLKPSTILFPAEGEGRNSVFAASQGWNVDAIDSSEVAQKKALQLANERGCQINYLIADLAQIELPADNYDVIAWCFLHMPAHERSAFLQQTTASLKPGGRLIFESFSKKQLGRSSGGPKNSDLLYNLEDLKVDLTGLTIELEEEIEVLLDEGTGHQGKAIVIRILATKN